MEEEDPAKKLEWLQFGKSLFNVHKEVERYDTLMQKFIDAPQVEWEAIVAEHRSEMMPAFFEHLQRRILLQENNPVKQDQLKTMTSALISMVEMYDQAAGDRDSLEYAKDAVQDVLKVSEIMHFVV